MDTLQRCMPVAGQNCVDDMLKIALYSEERIFQAAINLVKIHVSVDWDNYGVLALDVVSCKGWKMGCDASYQFGDEIYRSCLFGMVVDNFKAQLKKIIVSFIRLALNVWSFTTFL